MFADGLSCQLRISGMPSPEGPSAGLRSAIFVCLAKLIFFNTRLLWQSREFKSRVPARGDWPGSKLYRQA
jgi:hypothetical protein